MSEKDSNKSDTFSTKSVSPQPILPYKLFLEDDIRVKEPVHLYHEWYMEAKKHSQIIAPNTMCLTTCDQNGVPSARMITVSNFTKQGFQFNGNMSTRKGRQLENNPLASLTVDWPHLSRSVRITGTVEPLPINLVQADFKRKPMDSKLTSLLMQGQPVKSRKVLENKVEELKKTYQEYAPMPDNWAGYLLVPRAFEFVQRHPNLLHDRIRFRRQERDEKYSNLLYIGEDDWVYERLWP